MENFFLIDWLGFYIFRENYNKIFFEECILNLDFKNV